MAKRRGHSAGAKLVGSIIAAPFALAAGIFAAGKQAFKISIQPPEPAPKRSSASEQKPSYTREEGRKILEQGDPYGLFAQAKAIDDLKKKYNSVIMQHAANESEIKALYTAAREEKDYFSPAMEQIIDKCIGDLQLAEDVITYQKEWDRIMLDDTAHEYHYSTFERLAIIYEKRKQYSKALEVCFKAKSLSVKDMGKRIARLQQKEEQKK